MTEHAAEVASRQRFEFGKNWEQFLDTLNEARIAAAEDSLRKMLGVEDLQGRTFLDLGCGSGLFSLAARRLGAAVHSLDYDPRSVACAQALKARFFADDDRWTIEEGSVLDRDRLRALGVFDVVYSWGVLHHTGAMWTAMDNVVQTVAPRGTLFIAIYNHQQLFTAYWKAVKKLYVASPSPARRLMEYGFYGFFAGGLFVADTLRGRDPRARHAGHGRRGMNVLRDVVDWIGGWPFEVATPDEVFRFYRDRGFSLTQLKTCGAKHGCNEFVFIRN